MAFKTILAVTGSDLGDRDLQLAAELCREVDAHLAVLVMALAAPPPLGRYAAAVSEAWLEERQADMDKLQQRTAAVSALLSRQAISSDVSSEYQEEAWADETVGRRARYTDLVFLGPELLSRAVLKGRALEGALFSSGKPVLLVPHGSKPRLKPNRVIVAWNSRLEASNAVSRTIEVLSAADAVHVVLVDPEGDEGTEPGADIAGYLARHGAQVTVERLPSQGRTVADTLRQHAIDISADLLVMGAYGHSRLRQRIFGGVTRSMIDKPPLPILMAH